MKNRFRLIRRGERNQFYCVDKTTGKRTSLKTTDKDSAQQMMEAKKAETVSTNVNLRRLPNFYCEMNSLPLTLVDFALERWVLKRCGIFQFLNFVEF